MKRLTLALCAALAWGGLAASGLACQKPAKAASIDSSLVDWINAQRRQHGLATLFPSAALDRAAQNHACDMADKGYFSHTGANGSSVADRVRAQGYRWSAVVENIYKSSASPTADGAAGYWKKSQGHWANILNRKAREIGLGIATDGRNTFYVFVAAAP